MLIVNGKGGTGKTMTVNILLARSLCRGLRAAVIDRAGHFRFLASLVAGAIEVSLGGKGNREAICPWDVPDTSRVEQRKIDYLLALHSLLLSRHDGGGGLGDLEENLLALAIREVYARCALTGEQPRELILQEELFRREALESNAGASDIAATLRNLALRLNNYVGAGPYAYLTDWPTTVSANAPLVIFDTRAIPDSRAGAALFVICEHVTERIIRDRGAYLSGHGPGYEWAGRFALLIDEAWKLVQTPATGRWLNDLIRRSRHLALWLIGISQQLSDFDNEQGRALLNNAAMRLFLGQDAKELSYMRDTLALTTEQIAAISSLRTAKREYATAFLMNGSRGSGTISIRVSDLEYWMATSDPIRDEPIRRRALRDAREDPWEALRLLATPQWHARAPQPDGA
jgi:type IV secretory pathway VirB4 component